MNTTQLKAYAPKARKAFIAAVSAQAARLCITATAVAPAERKGNLLVIGGQVFPVAIAPARNSIIARIDRHGFDAAIEAIAYTWFNRFAAIRYMELHGYFEHGYRVLSHPEGHKRPEIVDHAANVDLPGLDRARAVELKLDGTKDEELYRLLLKAQCNALNQAMPFLFEKIGDETELLLPANLLHTDSLIRQMVESIDESAWDQIEIIGWLYQSYISERKDQVIGKVVTSEDIPAATQLFTPNWIVKYMVQNSLGAQWLATYPQSTLRAQMEYYIEPAAQTDEVNAQIKAITPTSLNPQEITLIDPACGSGHILVEAYALLKSIYLERGYRQRDVAKLVLEKNLFGLDIDDRAAQLSGFALMMKGRADDRQLFERGVKLNVIALVDSADFDPNGLAQSVKLSNHGLQLRDLTEIKELFAHATTFGSLIQVPEHVTAKLSALKRLSETTTQDLFASDALNRLRTLVRQAEVLAAQYDAVVANPPYMGGKYLDPMLKRFAAKQYKGYEKDLFSCFIARNIGFGKAYATASFMTPMVWMFLESHERLRDAILKEHHLSSLVHLEYNASGAVRVPLCTFVVRRWKTPNLIGTYISLTDYPGEHSQGPRALEAIRDPAKPWCYRVKPDEFRSIPGSPIAYSIPRRVRRAFVELEPMASAGRACSGLQTGDNDLYLRRWFEVSIHASALSSSEVCDRRGRRWLPHRKGGNFRRWYGNYDYVLDWNNEGSAIKANPSARPQNTDYWFREAATWSHTSSALFSVRFAPPNSTFNVEGPSYFGEDAVVSTALLCSAPVFYMMQVINPTLHFLVGDVAKIPMPKMPDALKATIREAAGAAIAATRLDWDAYERSWDFQSLPLLTVSSEPKPTLDSSYSAWIAQNRDTIAEIKRLEKENNRLFIDAYGLADELIPDVPIEQITLTVNPAYRYGGKLTEEEQRTRFREDTMRELVSYAVGCVMGRYSLDTPGLIYAHSGNEGFDKTRYTKFPADEDGIVPLTDVEWFDDDAAHRVVEFISVAWDKAHLEDNLTFLASNLSPKKDESSRETLRRYLSDRFFKDHLQTYKTRPIYWLFSSGRQKAFQCLVYLHRYNAGTLARMRSEYVIPLQGRMTARLDKLQGDIQSTTSTAHSKALNKAATMLKAQQTELLAFDEKLRHHADLRIALDLDDGVKVNYGKFGDLLAEVKKVTGGAEDDA